MAIGRSRKSSSVKNRRQRRDEYRRREAGRKLHLEPLEDRRLLAVGPQLIGIQPNRGELLKDGDIRNVAPEQLTFRFDEGQVIDESTLDAIRITRAGGDGQFAAAVGRTDFNTAGRAVMEFQAVTPGPAGNDISLVFTKSNRGTAGAPRITVEGKTIFVELNNTPQFRSTMGDLRTAINNHAQARQLVRADIVFGPANTDITTPAITYSPVELGGANVAQATTNFNTGTNLDVTFSAVQQGPAANGITLEFTKRDRGGAAPPLVQVLNGRRISIELNSNPANPTTAGQLVSVFNANPQARALVEAELRVGDPDTNIASPAINYSPLTLRGASDQVVTPGWVGLGDSAREVIFRFAERLPDDLYRVDIVGSGTAALRNVEGLALNDRTDDGVDNGADFSLRFELDLGAQVLAVVPQPITRTSAGTLQQSSSQIEVYFNNDDLDPITATDPAFYQLIDTNNTVDPSDDIVRRPVAVQYFPDTDRAVLTFSAPLQQLTRGGAFRLRIGTSEVVPSQTDPQPPTIVDLQGVDPGSSYASARSLGQLNGSQIVAAAIKPEVHRLPMPGSSDEPGHRRLEQYTTALLPLFAHLHSVADPTGGITTLFYNFRSDYGVDPEGNQLINLITAQQRQRAREAFEIYGRLLGVQFVESATQGFTIVTGDMRAVNPRFTSQANDGVVYAHTIEPLSNDLLLVLDNAETWFEGFGSSDNPNQISWFETVLAGIGSLLGLGDTHDLPPGTAMGSEPALGFGQAPEPVYPGDHDIVHGQHLYRPESSDIDMYRFQVASTGWFSAETIAERHAKTSLLDTVISLYQEVDGQRQLIARNDDYFSKDSYLERELQPGIYFVGVTASGNDRFNPVIENSGYGGKSEGDYELRLTFRPEATRAIVDLDNSQNANASATSQATRLDGNGDGTPGGVFNFWFRVDPTPIFVDKVAPAGGTGTLTAPYNNIATALAAAQPGDVVRIVGNGGADGQLATPADAQPYLIGFDLLGRPLPDGSTLDVPQGVTVMFDRGAVVKLRRAHITAGSASPSIDRSASALQVLGTPRLLDAGGNVIRDALGNPLPGSVYFTSYNDESLGGDSNPAVVQTPQPGDWGGLLFRNDVDRGLGRFDYERRGIFLNYVNQADLRYGGGTVVIQGIPQTVAPVEAIDARPTITFNSITASADAALAANPNSFEHTTFHEPLYQTAARFTSDYQRVGPHIHGNRLLDNSINGLFIHTATPAGGALQEMTVSGRWDDTDVVHVVAENLRIRGNPGGPLQTLVGPDVNQVQLQALTVPGGNVPEGTQSYRLTFVDAAGNETPASDVTSPVGVRVTNPLTGQTQAVRLTGLPTAPSPYVERRLYRSVKDDFVLVAVLNATSTSYTDTGDVLGGLLEPSLQQLTARLSGRLDIAPGTIVKLNKAGIETSFGAQLIAEGTAESNVIFTSLLDARYGAGGTFATSDEAEAQPGDWSGLYFGHVSRGSLDHAVVAYAGGVAEIPGTFAAFNPVEIHRSQARIANSVFENNAEGLGGQALPNRGGRGTNASGSVFVRGAQPTLLRNIFVGNEGPVISIDVNSLNGQQISDPGRSTGNIDRISGYADNSGPLIRENRLGDNQINGMQVRGGTLTTEGVWDDTDIAHVVLEDRISIPDFHTFGGLRLESSGSESLVVKLSGADAGFTATGRPLDITDRIGGSLQIIGQPGFPVVLTSLRDDTAAAGFTPDGRPQGDTNNDGSTDPGEGGDVPLLPTLPDVPSGTRIDNNVPVNVPGHFSFQPVAGGSGFEAVTAQGNTQLFQAQSFIFDFLNFIDVGANGQAIDLGTTNVTQPPRLTAPDEVTSAGTFVGPNGPVNWQVRTYFQNGVATLFNEVTFSSSSPLGNIRFINYLDEDVLGISDDLLYLPNPPGSPDFQAFTLDNAERIGYSQGGFYAPGPELVNATWEGWAADAFPALRTAITGPGTTYSVPGNINQANLTPFNDPALGQVYGLADVTTAFAWALNPTATSATVTTYLNLIRQDPTIVDPGFAGDWGSVRLEEYSHDRNVEVVTERETGRATLAGTNDTPATAQYVGQLAPHEKAGDDVRRLGFQIHGSLNRPADLDVYSFDAQSGTEVWFDIDRTSHGLDTVLELLDSAGRVLARSDNSLAESEDTSLLQLTATERTQLQQQGITPPQASPLSKSPFNSRDLWSTNPRDAGMRLVLPGPAGAVNTYHVRVRSSSSNILNLQGGLTSGAYQLQIRLRELDEVPGSTIQSADIRYATTGIEIVGLPAHSPLTGEAAEVVDPTSPTRDNNNDQTTADVLGNLLNTDRGTLSVAGELFTATDVDWYQFDVRYDSIRGGTSPNPRHLATIFDIDYADGFARANTNLWVFDDQARLVLIGRDSNTPDDRPISGNSSVDDLSRGSIGALDPFIGTVQLPAEGFATGRYYVAVSSNAVVPAELEQFLSPAPSNPLVRLEPINSVNRIAEDRVNRVGQYTTGNAPTIPVLFGESNAVSLFPPAGNRLRDGETFTITNGAGNSMTYEFDVDGQVSGSNVPVPYATNHTAGEVAQSMALAINLNPPNPGDFFAQPTAAAPAIRSSLSASANSLTGQVRLVDFVTTTTLLNEVATTDPFTNQLQVQPITRSSSLQQAPQVRQLPAQGYSEMGLYVSRPAVQPFGLGDVTLFVSQPGLLNRTELVSVDPFSGQLETRIGAFGANVGDIAMDPRGMNTATGGNNGGLFAYSIPQSGAINDATVGHYIQINPGSLTPNNLGVDLGDDGIETYQEDPANPGTEVRSTKDGVGVFFHAITFNNQESSQQVRGYAIGTRADTFVDPQTGRVVAGPPGVPNPANILFEFNPNTGAATNPPNTANRKGGAILTAGGTQIRDRGALDTTVDAFPAGGGNTTITGVDATTISFGTTLFNIEDGDIFGVDQNGDGIPDFTFEFDTGPEFYFSVNPAAAVPRILLDGDTFVVDGVQFEFDTGSVLVVNAINGNQLIDGGTIMISDNAVNPSTVVFEFDNNGNAGGNTPISFTAADNQQSIISKIVTAINNVPNFNVTAVQLPGTNRITLLNESTLSGATVNAQGVALAGRPGVAANSIRIPVEETWTADEIGQSISSVINSTPGGNFRAGAVGNRLNFAGALTASFAGVTNPVFGTVNPNTNVPTGVAGTIGNFNFPISFLASDNAAEIAERVRAAVVGAGIPATRLGATVFIDQVTPPAPQPIFVCTSLGTPPLIGAPGVQDCPLFSGGVAPGGTITGAAFVGPQMYAVTDTGALFRVANSSGGAFSTNSQFNVADYIDGSLELLQAANPVVQFEFDPITGEIITTTEPEPIQFAGLVAGPQNAEGGRYANLLFGIDVNGRIFAFDTHGRPQPVFAGGLPYADTGITGANGLAFSNLDDNLWHVTNDPTNRHTAGHGVNAAFDGSRVAQNPQNNSSFYFGYESPTAQRQFGTNAFAPATQAYTYDFPGGAHGSLISNSFSLAGYASADRPTLYFNYFLETEQADASGDTTLQSIADRMRDAVRVYVSGDDGSWQLLTTNNSDRDPLNGDWMDEFDPFMTTDPVTNQPVAEQKFRRGETFDNSGTWRQARVDLAPYAGRENLRLRFDFSTAGGMSAGGMMFNVGDTDGFTYDLNVAGNELRAIAGANLRDGQYFTVTDLVGDDFFGFGRRDVVAAFEFDLGPTLVVPTGTAIDDGDRFTVDGRVYEFDTNGSVGATNNIPHVPVPFVGSETAGELAALIQQVLVNNPPPPQEIIRDLISQEPSDTLSTAFAAPLDGSTQVLRGTGMIGDNASLTDFTMDVDLLSFRLDAGDTVTIQTDTTRVATQLNTYLRLFDANGNQLAANDNKDPTNPFSRDSEIVFTATQRGTYYVGISGSHNANYLPTAAGSGTVAGSVSQGLYEYQISISDPSGPQRVGNRLNLPNARTVSSLGLPASFVDGAGGVSTTLTDDLGQPVPVIPVPIHVGMSNLHVADAIRTALADHLAGGSLDAFKARNEIVQVVGYGIGDAGPLGLSGPSDPRTFMPNSGLFGDQFGAFSTSAGFNGQTTQLTPGALRMQNNQFEGFYIDDIIIGFAARGEMVTGGTAAGDQTPVAFVPNTAQPANEINRGLYQLEIRQATPYGLSDPAPNPTLLLTDGFDVNDRLASGTSITVENGSFYADGQTFRLSGGGNEVVFEFEDLTRGNGVGNGNVAIGFDPGDSAAAMARRIRNAINQPQVQQRLSVRAATSDGAHSGIASTSSQLHLFGEVSVLVGLFGNGPTGQAPVAEPNDTLQTAVDTGVLPGGRQSFQANGVIGDNPQLARLGADVDLYRVELAAGELITVDIDASELDSPLDSLLRVFDANGQPVLVTDAFGVETPLVNDDALAPGERLVLFNKVGLNLDSYLSFQAPADGVYYLGVSSFANDDYDPQVQGSGRPGQGGHYTLTIQRPLRSEGLEVSSYQRRGDQNTFRDQGQVIVKANRISHSLNFGIQVDAGPRTAGTAPHPGPVRNLSQPNSSRLIPGLAIVNNLIVSNQEGGISLNGDPNLPGEQAAPVPFGRIVNNTIAGTVRESTMTAALPLTALPGLTGGNPANTTVYFTDLSLLNTPFITALTLTDNSASLGSDTGRFSGVDLDAVRISDVLATNATQLATLPGRSVFDFSPAGTVLVPGQQAPPADPSLFGTLGGNVDGQVATLGSFDASGNLSGSPQGFVSLGEGGSITFHFDPPLAITAPLYLYIGEVVDRGEGGLLGVRATRPAQPTGVGIQVQNNVSPTLLNNVISNVETGIDVDASSTSLVIGGTLYHNITTNTSGTGLGDFPLVVDPAVSLFVDPARGNYYPARRSPLIDSAIGSLEDRFEMVQIRTPLGIEPAPIVSPKYDLAGQLRVDDPSVAPPPGLGSSVFLDRGALDRADFAGPIAQLLTPLDNGADDADPTESLVNLLRVSLDRFEIQLNDNQGTQRGIGIDPASVTPDSVLITQDGRPLVQGIDYRFSYNSTNNVIRLTPLAGVWDEESNYVIELAGRARHVLFVSPGDKLADGDSFQITDAAGITTTFEYDSGYQMQIPQTLALQIPQAGGGPGGVADGDTITVSNATRTVTLELDNNGVVATGNTRVAFTAASTQGEIADAIVAALQQANLQLSPVNAGGGLVHLGVNGTQTMSVTSSTIGALGVAAGVVDGQQFRIDDGTRVVTFEFRADQFSSPGAVPIPISYSQTHEQIAVAVATAINAQNLGLATRHVGDGLVHVGGGLNHIVTLLNANVTLSGEPGAEQAFGFRIPTAAGSFRNLITDGQRFTISNGTTTVTFEFDDNGNTTPGNVSIPFTNTTTTSQLANTLVNRIRNAGLGLFPFNAGNGRVVLGGDANYSLDLSNSALTQTGQPGVPAAVPIPFVPGTAETAVEVAEQTAAAINNQRLQGITARADGDRVLVFGASSASGAAVAFSPAIQDLAGNPLRGNQDDGSTRFTIFVGVGMDYGDAPSPYPTLRADNGARHVLLEGFSLGATVQLNADGQPSPNADAHPDDDGVVFAGTPLIPNRNYSITVSTSGIAGPNPVVPFGVLDAWIDWNRDGVWSASERILTNRVLSPSSLTDGRITFNLVVPPGAVPGDTFARFRLSRTGTPLPTGEADAGEVEDYKVTIGANPWQNPDNRFDVNNDGAVSPLDVLLVINYINENGTGPLPLPRPANRPFVDVSGNGLADPADALQLINHLNDLNAGLGEGEAAPAKLATSSANHLDDLLALDEGWGDILDDVGGALAGLDARDAVFASLI